MLDQVRASWVRIGKPDRVTAAVSGGADSATLLLILRQLSEELGFFLSAAHVDHGLRNSSFADAEYVRSLCASLSVPCRVYRLNLNGSSEDDARRARYEALFDACAQDNTSCLALAHHRRDQAETMLLHLFRGSGGKGLAAMREYAVRSQAALWRPLLNADPDSIRSALLETGVSWREDETNEADDYRRNYLRHHVLPLVSRRFPGAEEAMARAAGVLALEDDYFQSEALRFLRKEDHADMTGPCRWIRYQPLHDLHPALRMHVLRLFSPVSLAWEHTNGISALKPGDKINLPEGWRAACTNNFLHFLSPDPPAPVIGKLDVRYFSGEVGDGKLYQAVPRKVLEKCELRFRRPGDVIHPLGGPGDKSLQDYWVDKKTEQPFRAYLPLLCVKNRVIWSVGVGPGEEARVKRGDDAVLVRYEGYLPGYSSGRKS